jgi:glycosyltransferase involved in cell wall biosynthesis
VKKKVLIITYYWPPAGGAGVQRWLKFCKYLPQFGWQPVIYTPLNPEIPVEDNSLLHDIPPEAEIIKTPITEPYSLYKKFTGRSGEQINTGFLNEKGKTGIAEKIAVWLRGNLFIPDARRFWITPSVTYLKKYVEKNPVDVIISSGPPHSMHMIALGLKKKTGIKWIADFRDPWTNIDYYHDLMLSSFADKKHHRLEKEVLQTADKVIAVGKTMAEEFQLAYGTPVTIITNGFDSEDLATNELNPDLKFTIAHIGTMVKTRNPEMLWKALSELITDKQFAADLLIRLTGKVDFTVRNLIDKYQLNNYVEIIEYLPHDKVIRVQQQSQLLLLVLNNTQNAKGILTGKLFEYIASGRPVLCIGVDGDAAEIIRETNSGITCSYEDKDAIKNAILNYYILYKQGKLQSTSDRGNKYSRKALTAELSRLLNETVQ